MPTTNICAWPPLDFHLLESLGSNVMVLPKYKSLCGSWLTETQHRMGGVLVLEAPAGTATPSSPKIELVCQAVLMHRVI